MVISEKQVADQLKALNIGFNPTKEQIEETLTYIDTIRVNHPNAYAKHKEGIFDPYEKAIHGLESQYGEFKRGIILQTADAEKALQQIVDRSVQEGKNPNIDDATREAAKKSVENIKQGYTERMLPTFDARIKAVKEKLATGDDRAKKLLELLEAVLKNATSTSVNALQNEMLSGRTGVAVSKKWDPDGYFGPLTMNALEKIAGIKSEEAKVAVGVQSTAGKTVSNEAKQSPSLVSDLRTKAAAAGTTVSDAVSKAVSDSGTKSEAKTETSVSTPALKWIPQNGFILKDGSKVQGMYVEEGRMWFIGAKGERQEVNTALLSDGVTAKKIEALNENAKKLAALASDAELLLQATANHARIANWPNPKSWEDKISEFGKMLQALDISDEIQARRAIVKFIQDAPSAKWDLAGEFADVFNYADNDAERHAKVYKYIRGSWYNLGASGAGFDGGSDMLSNRIASTELLKQNIGPKELEAFITQWMNGNWSNASDDAVSKAIVQSAKNAGGAFQYLATVYNNEKWLPNFVKSFKSSIKQLSEAYKDPKIDTELAKVIKTENEREAYKRESRNAKLMTLLGTTVLARHLKNKPQERTWNFELDTFASINGTGTLEISDSTAKYIRNDLWKDVAIEVVAIGVGAVTAGFGAAAIHGLAAARWTARAGEIARIGTRVAETGKLTLNGAGKVMTRVVGGGVGFEVGHGAVSGVARGKDFNEWYSTEAFLQSMAFAGAFEVAGKILKLAKVPGFDPTKTILEQKTLLAKYVWADALASLGVSYSISWKHGEDYTFQEALQAIAMAALFRTAMTHIEGVKFRAKKSTQGIIVEPEIAEQVANTRTKLAGLGVGESLNVTPNIQVKRTSDGYRVIDRTNWRTESHFGSIDELMMSGFSKEAWAPGSAPALTYSDPATAFKLRTPGEKKRGTKTSALATEKVAAEANKSVEAPTKQVKKETENVGEKKTTADTEKKAAAVDEEGAGKKKEKQITKEVIEVVNDPVEGNVEIKTGKDASMNKVDKDGKKTPLTPDQEAGVLVRNKDKGELAKIFSGEKQLYHVVDVLEPLYKSAKKGLAAITTEPIAKLDGKIRDIPYLVGTLYGIPASTFKWVVVKPTGLALKFTEKTIAVALHDISTPVDIGWNILASIRNKDHRTFGHFLRSIIYADRRDKATYVKDTNALWEIDYRRLNVLILLAMGVTASSVYREEEWVVRGPVSQMKDAILLGGITTYLKSNEAYEWVNLPGIGELLKKLKTKVKSSPQVQETPESKSIGDVIKSAQDSLENSGKNGWKSPTELIQSTKDDYMNE